MSRIPPHTARIVSAWPEAHSRPRHRSPSRTRGRALAGRLFAVARALHLLRAPARAQVTGRVGRHA